MVSDELIQPVDLLDQVEYMSIGEKEQDRDPSHQSGLGTVLAKNEVKNAIDQDAEQQDNDQWAEDIDQAGFKFVIGEKRDHRENAEKKGVKGEGFFGHSRVLFLIK
jgi:hypothetical protein